MTPTISRYQLIASLLRTSPLPRAWPARGGPDRAARAEAAVLDEEHSAGVLLVHARRAHNVDHAAALLHVEKRRVLQRQPVSRKRGRGQETVSVVCTGVRI